MKAEHFRKLEASTMEEPKKDQVSVDPEASTVMQNSTINCIFRKSSRNWQPYKYDSIAFFKRALS